MSRKSLRIKMAPQNELASYEAEVAEICEMLLRVLNIDIGFLSDMSSMGDFRPRGEEHAPYYARLSAGLGVPIMRGDSVLDICRRLRQKRLS